MILPIVCTWAAVVLPYVAVGADDLEEYFTGVATTKLAIEAIRRGAWPFWSTDLGLGLPQPLRFHFITHPLSPLCAATDCHALLRAVASLHVLIGAVFVAMLVMRFTRSRVLASASGMTWCLSSSVIQPMLIDDWPITAINESTLPVLLYAVFAIHRARDRRQALLWSLVLGGLSGLLLSMSFPVIILASTVVVSLALPNVKRTLPWLALAASVTAAIGAAQVYHIYEELIRTPASVVRHDHDDFRLSEHLWSAFARPLTLTFEPRKWRTVFIGAPFAVAALLTAVFARNRAVRPLQIGLLFGAAGLVTPAEWLFNLNTAQWLYRAQLNVFAILLAACGLHLWCAAPARRIWMPRIAALQLCWAVAGFSGPWYAVFAVAAGLDDPGRHRLGPPGIAQDVATLHHAKPGRVILSPKTYEAMRLPVLVRAGLAPNQLPMLGVPTISAPVFGIATDDLAPTLAAFQAEITADPAAIRSKALLDVLGIRYVLALPDEPVAAGLRLLKTFPRIGDEEHGREVRLYENAEAWAEAFFVEHLPTTRVPRLDGCNHDRFLCADFSRYPMTRRPDPIHVSRLPDGLRLTFEPVDAQRHILVTQWYREGWRVTEGRASLERAAEQLVGVTVEPNEAAVTIRYRPIFRATLFAAGLATEGVVAIGVLLLALASQRLAEQPTEADVPSVRDIDAIRRRDSRVLQQTAPAGRATGKTQSNTIS